MSGLYRKLHGETPDPSANTRSKVAVPDERVSLGNSYFTYLRVAFDGRIYL